MKMITVFLYNNIRGKLNLEVSRERKFNEDYLKISTVLYSDVFNLTKISLSTLRENV